MEHLDQEPAVREDRELESESTAPTDPRFCMKDKEARRAHVAWPTCRWHRHTPIRDRLWTPVQHIPSSQAERLGSDSHMLEAQKFFRVRAIVRVACLESTIQVAMCERRKMRAL